jgi:hypothetical protein
MGLPGTDWELGFNQSRFHHVMQDLRICDFSAFSSPSALPPCYGPLGLSTSGKAVVLWTFLRFPSRLCRGYGISCHGARNVWY